MSAAPRGRRGPVDRAGQPGAAQFIMLTLPLFPQVVDLRHLVGSTAPADRFHGRRRTSCASAADGPRRRRRDPAMDPRIPTTTPAALEPITTHLDEHRWRRPPAIDAMTTSTAVPSYLDGDWHRGWGALSASTTREPQAARPAVVTTDIRRQWAGREPGPSGWNRARNEWRKNDRPDGEQLPRRQDPRPWRACWARCWRSRCRSCWSSGRPRRSYGRRTTRSPWWRHWCPTVGTDMSVAVPCSTAAQLPGVGWRTAVHAARRGSGRDRTRPVRQRH